MMINKRLIALMPEAKKHIAFNVICQSVSLFANILLVFSLSYLLSQLLAGLATIKLLIIVIAIVLFSSLVRALMAYRANRESFLSSVAVKKTIREKIYEKLLSIGPSYTEKISTASLVQLSTEGAEQLETYFGSYLPQFFYSMLSPVILFIVISFLSLKAAIILFICVPLIPLSIVVVQKIAKRLLSKYWSSYEALGDNFLENLELLTTLKIYNADEERHKEINKSAEHFRKITMKVLTMQLNSIIVMDIIAYGGAALGIIVAASEYLSSSISFMSAFIIILLSADFFLPLRALGSFFHVAMNGMAAADKIFTLLDIKVNDSKVEAITNSTSISIKDLSFSYTEGKEALHKVSLSIPEGGFIAVAGASGCGKSTLASLLTLKNETYTGSIKIGPLELSTIKESSLFKHITLVSHESYIFKGSVRDNLLIAKRGASDDELWRLLEEVNLASFLRANGGLDTPLLEGGSNLSGGQRQRLAIARALLKDSDIYIFDEATSNIDVESEDHIISLIQALHGKKSILMISHRLKNIISADKIYFLSNGSLVEEGSHKALLKEDGLYAKMFKEQEALENLEEVAL